MRANDDFETADLALGVATRFGFGDALTDPAALEIVDRNIGGVRRPDDDE
jgi:hypothetical protein